MKRYRVLLALLSLLVGTSTRAQSVLREEERAGLVAPPFFVNCGGDEGNGEEPEGMRTKIRQLADQPFSDQRGYGYSSGESEVNWFSGIWGTSQPQLYRSARVNPGSYRFDLPEGDYIVALGFCETREHAEGRRVFDVIIQDVIVGKDLDIFAVAGNAQAFRLTHSAKVRTNEGLTIRFQIRGAIPPLVNVIWVFPKKSLPLEPPANLRGMGSYGLNVLFWDHTAQETVASYWIERRAEGESVFTALHGNPVPVSRWLDFTTRPGLGYEYRIRCVDVEGVGSDFSPILQLKPKTITSSTLPVYSLEVPVDTLAWMQRNVNEDRVADALFVLDGEHYPVQMRLRGASTRQAAKKSYRIEFPNARPAGRSRVIYLKAEPHDPTLQQEKLTCDVFASMGLPVSRAEFVNVVLNGRYEGVFLDIEPIRTPFKKRAGLDSDGTLIRAATFQHLDGKVPGALRGNDGSLEEVTEFIRQINRTDRGEFERFLRDATDWDKVRDYLVATIITHRSEIESDDYFYYRDPKRLRWSFIPWDHNNGNFGIRGPATEPERPFIPLYGQTLQAIGPTEGYWYVLPSRILNNAPLREEYLTRLASAVQQLMVSGRIDDMVDKNFRKLASEALLDPFRWPPGQDRPFHDSARKLKKFWRDHARRLLDLIAAERNREASPLIVNEFFFTPDSGWIELHNRGRDPVALARYSLGNIEEFHQARHRFGKGDAIQPGEFKLVKLTGGTVMSSLGGSVGLMLMPPGRSEEEARDRIDRIRVVDFFFYGHQNPRYSYGRSATGFGFMHPTPGHPNREETFSPPSLLADGGVQWKNGRPHSVLALITGLCPGEPPQSVQLHFHAGGHWQRMPMRVAGDCATAILPDSLSAEELSYHFVASAPNGLERYGPLTAPMEVYRAMPPSD